MPHHLDRMVVDDLRTFANDRNDVTYCLTAEAAIEAVSGRPSIDSLYLDHDLGLDAEGNLIDVRPFVTHLEELAYFGDPLKIDDIFIITSNHATGGGSRWIEQGLRRYSNVKIRSAESVGLIYQG